MCFPTWFATRTVARSFGVEGKDERITVVQGPKFPVAVVYVPQGESYLCFEPMAASINAMNPSPDGTFPPIQSAPLDGTWRESFWIKFSSKHLNSCIAHE